jgi:hypothetical protein
MAHVSWTWSNSLCLLHSIHNFLVAGLRHRSFIHTSGYWLFVPKRVLGLRELFRELTEHFPLLYDCYVGLEFTRRRTSVSEVCGTYHDAKELDTHFVRFEGRQPLSAIYYKAATTVFCPRANVCIVVLSWVC